MSGSRRAPSRACGSESSASNADPPGEKATAPDCTIAASETDGIFGATYDRIIFEAP